MTLRLDEIGPWSEVKLEIIEKYASAYSLILKKKNLFHVYIDAFAGAGQHISRTTRALVPGSPKIALNVKPPFNEYYFIDIDSAKVDELRRIASDLQNVHVLEGDCNTRLLEDVFPHVKYADYKRGLCLLDPYGLHLQWKLIESAGKMKSIDMFLNFPIADMNRNVLLKDTQKAQDSDIQRMNSFWGDDSWRAAAYSRMDLFGQRHKAENSAIVDAFQRRLIEVAGFKYVPDPMPMRNSRKAVVYYLFFASQQKLADHIIAGIFKKYKNIGI